MPDFLIKRLFLPLLFCCLFSFKAQAAEFAFSEEWLALGHYQKSGGRYKSTLDSEKFFLSPQGKNNPQAELMASVELFENGDEATKCLFPARYKLLKRQGLVAADFPKCEELEKFYEDLRPSGVTLLFTDAFMNNPSSLFGHTLLRIDTARKGTQLLAHGANYGAFTAGEDNGMLYAVLGLTGGYFGGFTVKPYYDIINTYNNIENRDIWEFNLDLTPEELDFFVAHLWELGHNQSRYYFFSRNCSYMLMETLDAVRPSLHLAQQFPVQAIPLDTLKAVYRTPGLVKSVNYRPSRQAKIVHRYQLMSPEQQKRYLDIIKEQKYDLDGLSEAEQADVLETAYQFIQYQYVAEKLELKDYRRQSFKVLTARNRLKTDSRISDEWEGHSPLETHESMRATVGAGVRNGEGFQEISYRPAYHSLTDSNLGFLRGAEINFLNTVLRHYDSRDKTVLQQLDLVGIKSVSPMNEMFTPISYQINFAAERVMNPDNEKEGYDVRLTVGGGGTYALNEQWWAFVMGNSHAAYGGFLPDDYWAGLGFEAGVFADFTSWRLLASVEKIWATSTFADRLVYKAEAAYALSTNWAAAANYKYEATRGHDIDEMMFSLRRYF